MEDFRKKFVLALLAYAVKRDVDPQVLCASSGISFRELQGRHAASITAKQADELWKNASLMSGDPLFGLHFGESMQLAALGIIGQLVQTSATIGEALTNAASLTHLVTDMFSMQLEHRKNSFVIHFIPDKKKAALYPYTYRHMADYLMVFVIHEMDGLLLEKKQPLQVQVPYHIAEPYEYTRVFRCPRIRKTDGLSMEFPAKYLTMPILSANYELQQLLLQKMNALLQEASPANTWHSKVYNYLLTNSYLNAFSQETVAANFALSPRHLQRKLKEEGVSYQQIVESVKKNLSINYLTHGQYHIKDVAYMLGYNEPSAFLRAFKRWTGKTPAAFIKQPAK